MRIWKMLAILGILVLLAACTAQVQEFERPILQKQFVISLANTEIARSLTSVSICGQSSSAGIVAVFNTVNENWMIQYGLCAFVVDDATGEVTGP